MRENWGIRVVVIAQNGAEKVFWGQELERCAKNPHSRDDPYSARNYHKHNHRHLKGLKPGTVVAYPCGNDYIKSKVVRVVRAGNWQRVLYTVSHHRCLHQESVRVTKKLIARARRENRLWGAGLRPPPSRLTERHVVTKETFNHLRDWIFSTDLLEPVKASEQSTQRGHCFAVKEAVTTTFPRYQKSADAKGVDAVTEIKGLQVCIPQLNLSILTCNPYPNQAGFVSAGIYQIPQGPLHVHNMSSQRLAWHLGQRQKSHQSIGAT